MIYGMNDAELLAYALIGIVLVVALTYHVLTVRYHKARVETSHQLLDIVQRSHWGSK